MTSHRKRPHGPPIWLTLTRRHMKAHRRRLMHARIGFASGVLLGGGTILLGC